MNLTCTAAAVVLEDLAYPSGRLAAEAGDRVEIARGITTFYVLKDGELVYTTNDQRKLFRHFIIDVPLERIPCATQ